ncbi:hypothetical protein KKC59_01930, partial [bacterium]|nr:hypothetical protein [bacterium]
MINIELPSGSKISETNEKVKLIENILLSGKEVKDITILIGSNKDSDMNKSIQMLESHQANIMVDLN